MFFDRSVFASVDSRHGTGSPSKASSRSVPVPGLPIVLIVDDEPAIRDSFSTLLRLGEYAVTTAADGHEALARLREGLRPSVIILDLMMPGLNGWEFRVAQLADAALRDIPVIIVTGASERPMDPVLLNVAGMLRKPINADALLGTVGRIVRGM